MQGPPVLPRVDLDHSGPLEIDIYGDLHVGSPAFDEARFLEDLKETRHGGRHLVLNGDLFDMSGKHQKHGGIYEAKLSPEDCIDRLEGWLAPVADKILAVTSGNHDGWGFAAVGIDPVRQLVARLRVADRYMRHGGFLWTRHGRAQGTADRHGKPRGIEYIGFIAHGTGNSASSVSAERVARSFHADYYILGHTHAPLSTSETYYSVYPQNGSVVEHTKRIVVAPSYLSYAGYALEKRLIPRPIGKATVSLADGRKRVDVWLP